jgi:RHS repeat-associated protein
MRSIIALAVTAFAVAANANVYVTPVATAKQGGRLFSTTTALQNDTSATVTCEAVYAIPGDPNGGTLRTTYTVEAGRTQIEEATLMEAGAIGTLRFDCSGPMLIAARVQSSSDDGHSFDAGRLFRAVGEDNPIETGTSKSFRGSSDLLMMEVAGKSAHAHVMVTTSEGEPLGEKNYDIPAFAEQIVNLSQILMKTGSPVTAVAISGEGTVVVSSESQDLDIAALFIATSLPVTRRATSSYGGGSPARLLGTASFKAAPFVEPLNGMIYIRDRWYDPGTGEWLTPDRLGYNDSANLYAYAGGDPVNGGDPTGTRKATAAELAKIAQLKAAGRKLHDDWSRNGQAVFTTYKWGVEPGLYTPRGERESWVATPYEITTEEQYRNARNVLIEDVRKYEREIARADEGEAVSYTPWIQANLNRGQIFLGAATLTQSVINVVGAAAAPVLARNAAAGNALQPAKAAPRGNPMTNEQVRQWYLDRDSNIPELNEIWKQQSMSAEARARMAFNIRSQARQTAREMMTDPVEVTGLRERDVAHHQNPNGPTFELLVARLRAKGFSGDALYEEIVRSATRTDTETNRKFGQ